MDEENLDENHMEFDFDKKDDDYEPAADDEATEVSAGEKKVIVDTAVVALNSVDVVPLEDPLASETDAIREHEISTVNDPGTVYEIFEDKVVFDSTAKIISQELASAEENSFPDQLGGGFSSQSCCISGEGSTSPKITELCTTDTPLHMHPRT